MALESCPGIILFIARKFLYFSRDSVSDNVYHSDIDIPFKDFSCPSFQSLEYYTGCPQKNWDLCSVEMEEKRPHLKFNFTYWEVFLASAAALL